MHHRADSKADESVSRGADGLLEEVRNTANVLTLLWGEKRKKIDLRVAASDTVRNMHVKQIKASKLKEGIRGWGEVTGEPWGAGGQTQELGQHEVLLPQQPALVVCSAALSFGNELKKLWQEIPH